MYWARPKQEEVLILENIELSLNPYIPWFVERKGGSITISRQMVKVTVSEKIIEEHFNRVND